MGLGREPGDLAQSALLYSGEGHSEPRPKAQYETVELQRQLSSKYSLCSPVLRQWTISVSHIRHRAFMLLLQQSAIAITSISTIIIDGTGSSSHHHHQSQQQQQPAVAAPAPIPAQALAPVTTHTLNSCRKMFKKLTGKPHCRAGRVEIQCLHTKDDLKWRSDKTSLWASCRRCGVKSGILYRRLKQARTTQRYAHDAAASRGAYRGVLRQTGPWPVYHEDPGISKKKRN